MDKRPIETAPTDGTIIMLFCDDGAWRRGHFWRDDRWWLGNKAGDAYVLGAAERNPDTLTATHWLAIDDYKRQKAA